MDWRSWVGLGGEAVDWWQQRANISDARDSINKGYKQGRQDVKRWQGPYAKWGQKHMKGYDKLGEFSFSNEDFYRDPSYQWRMDQGMKNTMRQQAAQKQAGSGNTLKRLTEFGQGLASTEYQAAHDRAYQSWAGNVGYHKGAIDTGAGVAQNIGDNLATMAVGRGEANAGLYAAQSQINSEALSNSINQITGGGSKITSGLIDEAISRFGSIDSPEAISYLAKAAGVAKSAVMAGVNKVAGAAWGAFGAGPTTLAGGATTGAATTAAGTATGGAGTAAGSAAGMTAGTWAASVAGGFAVLGAFHLLNKSLGNAPEVGKMFRNLGKKQDPLQRIFSTGFNETWGGELRNVLERDAAGGRTVGNVSTAAKGMMISALISKVENPDELKQRDDIDKLVNTMYASLNSGYSVDRKWAKPAGITGAADGLAKLMPGLSAEFESLQKMQQELRRQNSLQETSTDNWLTEQNRIHSINQMQQDLLAKRAELRILINKRLANWERKRTAASSSAI
jgi:hypothetical protein